jgi:hypothetical protein
MANTLLTPDQITRKALQILHQKLTFVGSINRSYDDSFAQNGAKIGDTLRIRLPNQYKIRSGAALSTGSDLDTVESNTTLQVATQKGVDMSFTSKDLTLHVDDFADRFLEPAMAVLAANVEADAMSMYKSVPNLVDNDTAAISFYNILQGRKVLNDNLAPMDDSRTALLSTAHTAKLVDALKGLFQDSNAIKQQYREGAMGRTGGFDFYESTHVNDHTTGTAVKGDTLYNVNPGSQTGSTISVDTGTTTLLVGDVVTFAGCFAVHPETKVSTGQLKQFVITANSGTSASSLSIWPAIVTTGPKQNVSASPTNGGAVTKVGAGAGELLNSSMVYHKNAFTFASADLVLPRGVDMASRQVYDGISMRMVRAYNISDDTFPVRFDVLYGYKAIRPELACRIHADG